MRIFGLNISLHRHKKPAEARATPKVAAGEGGAVSKPATRPSTSTFTPRVSGGEGGAVSKPVSNPKPPAVPTPRVFGGEGGAVSWTRVSGGEA